MDADLLKALDEIADARGATRSELLRDLVRAEVTRERAHGSARAVAALTIVYDHHVRDLTEKLNEVQHDLGEQVRSTMHVHIDHDHCLETIVMQGRADVLQSVADKIIATRGVEHGALQLIALEKARSKRHAR